MVYYPMSNGRSISEFLRLLEARDQPIVLHCKTSGRAALSAASLKAMGYLHVKSIEGGFDAWQAAGKPVMKPDVPDFE